MPEHKISQAAHFAILESANGWSREDKLRARKIYINSGIESRHSVLAEFGFEDHPDNLVFNPANHRPSAGVAIRMILYEKYALELSVNAVNDCLSQLKLPLAKVTHVITFSCTGMYAPGLDIQLVKHLGLRLDVERICINFMGCYAGINALKTAKHIANSEPDAIVLVVGVEICTIHYRKSDDQDQVVANALFADGAAAAIVSNDEKSAALSLKNFYSAFDPSGNDEMVWRIGDFGFELRLSNYVPALIQQSISTLLQKLISKSGISQSQIDYYAIHPGGKKILEVCEEALQISHEQNKNSYDVLKNYGNMSSVTIFFVLQKFMSDLSPSDIGKNIFSCAFGPGLTIESMMLQVA